MDTNNVKTKEQGKWIVKGALYEKGFWKQQSAELRDLGRLLWVVVKEAPESSLQGNAQQGYMLLKKASGIQLQFIENQTQFTG